MDDAFHSEPVRWARDRLERLTGYVVRLEPRLDGKLINVDHVRKVVSVPPGQSLFRLAGLLTMATWRIKGGVRWVPDFDRNPRLTIGPAPEVTGVLCASCARPINTMTDVRHGHISRNRRILDELRASRDQLATVMADIVTSRDALIASRDIRVQERKAV